MKIRNYSLILCVLVLIQIYTHTSAQPENDKNWNTNLYFVDNFNPPRSNWTSSNWIDYPNDNKWRAHLATGVTHGTCEHQVYQKPYAIFNSSDSTMRLRAEYAGGLITSYEVPSGWPIHPNDTALYYYSGAITATTQFLYGYFEAQCKLPVHRGAFPAFWLWNSSDGNYREIDVFEYSTGITIETGDYGSPRIFSGQIYYENNSNDGVINNYGDFVHIIPEEDPDLTSWHTFGLEWSPRRVVWYFDEEAVGEYNGDSIPSLNMNLMFNYALDNWIFLDGNLITTGFPNDMTIDYLKVHKLKCDCGTNKIIQNNSQLAQFDYKLSKTITVGGYGYSINIPSNDKVVFRATDAITINGTFEVPLGSELELITHPCPQ